jgi:hypothetical protein
MFMLPILQIGRRTFIVLKYIRGVGQLFADSKPKTCEEPSANGGEVRVLAYITERAEAKIAFQSQDIDSHDTKTLAFIALNLAGSAVLVGARDSLQPWWWIPLLGAGISTALFAWTLWPRLFDFGPNLDQFYKQWGGSTELDFHRQMMGEYLNAVDHNRAILPSKEKAFNLGVVVLVLTIIVGAIFLQQSTRVSKKYSSGPSIRSVSTCVHRAVFVGSDVYCSTPAKTVVASYAWSFRGS